MVVVVAVLVCLATHQHQHQQGDYLVVLRHLEVVVVYLEAAAHQHRHLGLGLAHRHQLLQVEDCLVGRDLLQHRHQHLVAVEVDFLDRRHQLRHRLEGSVVEGSEDSGHPRLVQQQHLPSGRSSLPPLHRLRHNQSPHRPYPPVWQDRHFIHNLHRIRRMS